jgi:hypothetical protein
VTADGPWPTEVAHLPVCPKRGLPIPFIAEVDADGTGHFTILDDQRAAECAAGRLCAMCGLPMGALVALLGDEVSIGTGGYFIEPPVHERCGELAAGGLCPFMSRERVPRRAPEEGVALVGTTPDRLTEVGRTVPKRGWVMAITREYGAGLVASTAGSPVTVYVAGRIERVRRFRYDAAGHLAEMAPPVPPAGTMRRVQPRRPRSRRERRGAR